MAIYYQSKIQHWYCLLYQFFDDYLLYLNNMSIIYVNKHKKLDRNYFMVRVEHVSTQCFPGSASLLILFRLSNASNNYLHTAKAEYSSHLLSLEEEKEEREEKVNLKIKIKIIQNISWNSYLILT